MSDGSRNQIQSSIKFDQKSDLRSPEFDESKFIHIKIIPKAVLINLFQKVVWRI